MTERNTSSERLSERDVDRLLQRFFVEEVPPEFRQDRPPTALAQPVPEPLVTNTSSDSSRNLAGMLGILVSVTCCLIVLMFVPNQRLDETDPEGSNTVSHTDRGTQPTTEGSVPIEERPTLPYTSMDNRQDDPGAETEKIPPLEPELEIEIFPLRPDKPNE